MYVYCMYVHVHVCMCVCSVYAGKFGRGIKNLAVWQSDFVTAKFQSIYSHVAIPIISAVKASHTVDFVRRSPNRNNYL